MNKTNINKVIQDKFQDLDYDFKPEYWDKMENMLNASSLSSSTNTATSILGSKIFLYSISSFFLIAGGIGFYFIFNNQSTDCNDINNTNQIVLNGEQADNNINTSNTKIILQSDINSIAASNTYSEIIEISKIEASNIKSTKSYAVVSFEEIDLLPEEVINEILTIVNTSDCDPCKETNIKEIDVVLMEDSNLKQIEDIEDDDGIYIVSKLNLKDKADIKENKEVIDTTKEKALEKIDNSKVKNVKPMRKPSGRVFRKKGGLLKRFGL